ncbi:peptidase M13, partial [Salmonella enterica subsp. enterica serovar Typhimurium]|nr:peptidase M13 [Salmonella enterica subsp. enterica serovar Typhimurium]
GARIPVEVLATVIDNQPSFFDGVEGLLVDERLDQWKSWARWHAISSLASYLSSAFVDENFDFYGRVLNGTPALKARWKRGVSFVES